MAAAAPKSLDEADFGDLSAAPASSGDQDLWDPHAPLQSSPPAAEDSLWSAGGNGSKQPELVSTKAELANLESFGEADRSPSGLDIDDAAMAARKAAKPKAEEGWMTSEPTGSLPVPQSPAGNIAAQLQAIPPEKLEQIVREVAKQILQPILERIAWEVVPDLAEDIIKDEIKRLTQ